MRTLICTLSLGLMSTAAIAASTGTCDDADLDRDGTITQLDARIMSGAILLLDADLDYNEDGVTNVLDITAYNADSLADVEDFGADVSMCVTGGFDLTGDGKTNIVDVMAAPDPDTKLVIASCVLGNGELDYNDDQVINVLDATAMAADSLVDRGAFSYAASDQMGFDNLDLNGDGKVNVVDAVFITRCM